MIHIVKKIAVVVFFLVLFTNQFVFAAKDEYFSSNNHKYFINAQEFYKISGYKEVSKSEISVRKLILAKDLPSVTSQMKWNSEKERQAKISEIKDHLIYLDPQRQVYYFFSKKGDQKQGITKYAVFDAETKKLLTIVKMTAESY
ncbi:hypothetical protein [Pseudobacillus wudalianchiensis]|uniref:hypothetical protein n=1 Tax=Pseudobacillus wudalianchiensis TaxID=1743143 RepID=UPI00159F2D9F|nr:hypothetical protein [Bacillus wudalianchiensis]